MRAVQVRQCMHTSEIAQGMARAREREVRRGPGPCKGKMVHD